jgi:hypothetical protein
VRVRASAGVAVPFLRASACSRQQLVCCCRIWHGVHVLVCGGIRSTQWERDTGAPRVLRADAAVLATAAACLTLALGDAADVHEFRLLGWRATGVPGAATRDQRGAPGLLKPCCPLVHAIIVIITHFVRATPWVQVIVHIPEGSAVNTPVGSPIVATAPSPEATVT